MSADPGGSCALVDAARDERGGARGRAASRQVGLAAGAVVVVVERDNNGAVAVSAADHRPLPLKG